MQPHVFKKKMTSLGCRIHDLILVSLCFVYYLNFSAALVSCHMTFGVHGVLHLNWGCEIVEFVLLN